MNKRRGKTRRITIEGTALIFRYEGSNSWDVGDDFFQSQTPNGKTVGEEMGFLDSLRAGRRMKVTLSFEGEGYVDGPPTEVRNLVPESKPQATDDFGEALPDLFGEMMDRIILTGKKGLDYAERT